MGAVEPTLRESTAAVWAVCDQRVASALLQHVWSDVEPARIWSRVSFTPPRPLNVSKV